MSKQKNNPDLGHDYNKHEVNNFARHHQQKGGLNV